MNPPQQQALCDRNSLAATLQDRCSRFNDSRPCVEVKKAGKRTTAEAGGGAPRRKDTKRNFRLVAHRPRRVVRRLSDSRAKTEIHPLNERSTPIPKATNPAAASHAVDLDGAEDVQTIIGAFKLISPMVLATNEFATESLVASAAHPSQRCTL